MGRYPNLGHCHHHLDGMKDSIRNLDDVVVDDFVDAIIQHHRDRRELRLEAPACECTAVRVLCDLAPLRVDVHIEHL